MCQRHRNACHWSEGKISKIASLNINSLLKHIDELRVCVSKQQIDILAINETKLDSNIPMDLISVEGYNWVSMNRNRFGGGVGFYIRKLLLIFGLDLI